MENPPFLGPVSVWPDLFPLQANHKQTPNSPNFFWPKHQFHFQEFELQFDDPILARRETVRKKQCHFNELRQRCLVGKHVQQSNVVAIRSENRDSIEK